MGPDVAEKHGVSCNALLSSPKERQTGQVSKQH